MAFKRWLRDLIGENNYRKLDPHMEEHKISSHSVEGKAMRELMKEFDARKQDFGAGSTRDIHIDLPSPFQNLKITGNVKYTVVQGAVICGIEKLSSQKLTRADYCRHHYGVSVLQHFNAAYHNPKDAFTETQTRLRVVRGQLIWLMNKGDLVPSNDTLVQTRDIHLDFTKAQGKKTIIPTYRYSEDEDRPTRFREARSELDPVCFLQVDLTESSPKDFIVNRKGVLSIAVLLAMMLKGNRMTTSVRRGATVLAKEENIPYWAESVSS
ncbi:hypothetical protein BU23DRAFT_565748 [Bimuria novae-zelandiae CBS 107.79]|uniref:Uncharacterized protein n=1 Tax=Bimuria novae-zelandiae CBS 107.79 TaxID=1447943 RepID=A0A6A5VHW9_9PLEO|nr:hypothetical protein BU23DRAFT_565748 [Bimuria novae-zelandiae CBS 107.79]